MTSLIRSLPKNLRVTFVPAPNTAREFLAAVPPGEEPLLDALERWLRSTTGVVVPREAWDWAKVPEHLRPTYRVVDDDGTEQARGKDLEALKAPLRPQFAPALAEVASDSGLSRDRRDDLGVRHDRGVRRAAARRPRGARLPGAGRRGRDGRAAGLRLGRRGRGPAPARRTPAAAAGRRAPVDRARRARQRRQARAGRLAVPDRRRAARGLPAPRSPGGGRRPPAGARPEASYAALAEEPTATTRRTLRAAVADVLRVLERVAAGREGAQRPGRDAHAARAARTCGPSSAGWSTAGSSARPGATQLRRYPTYLAAARRSVASGSTPRSTATAQLMDQIADLQDAYLHQVDGAARGPAAGRGAAPGAVDARGVPRLAVGPAARHALPRQRPAHPTKALHGRVLTCQS